MKRYNRGKVVKPLSAFQKIRKKLSLKKTIAISLTLVGVIGSYITIFGYMSPRISVQPVQSMNPTDAISLDFQVTNLGSMDIYDVAMGQRFINYYINHNSNGLVFTERENYDIKKSEIGDVFELFPINGFFKVISSMKSGTMEITMPLELRKRYLDIEILVDYRPEWYPFKRKESFRFITKVTADGKIYWLPKPDEAADIYETETPKD